MKKLYILFCMVAFATSLQAQITTSLALDYEAVDRHFALDNGYNYSNSSYEINSRYSNADDNTLRYAIAFFDTLQFVTVNNEIGFYPRSATSLKLDSFSLKFVHQNFTSTNDSIRITVFNRNSFSMSAPGLPNSAVTIQSIWDTVIITNTSLSATPGTFVTATFQPAINSFAAGQTFGVKIDFAGDTTNKFKLQVGSRDDCQGSCMAAISKAGLNLGYYLNLDLNGSNASGYFQNSVNSALFFDCDQNGLYTEGACENMNLQNLGIIAYTTAQVSYGVAITADSLHGCPGTPLNLSANAYGSAATPYTYSWSTTSGTLTSTSDPHVTLILGNTSNAVVSVTITDANNVTTSNAVTVLQRGINVSIAGSNPVVMACGATSAITTSVTGVTVGKNYFWSTGASGSNLASITANTVGAYTVTVTNNFGCSATASVNVQYVGNVTNTVTFALPASPRCEDVPQTFINTSQKQNGWAPTWVFGDGNVGFTNIGTNTYVHPGVYSVYLQMDSMGCMFKSPEANVVILAASNSACLVNQGLAVTLSGNQSVCNGSYVILNPIVTNGTPPYTYAWGSTGDSLSCITCKHPDVTITQNSSYIVITTDANNQTAVASVNYTVTGGNNQMQASSASTVISCANPTNITTVTVTNGVSPYSFDWGNLTSSSGPSPQNYSYNTGGEYVISVRDAAGCVTSLIDTVDYQGIVITASAITQPLCEHTNTGFIRVSVSDGTAPYTYLWSTSATTDSLANVPAGHYLVTVTDATSCSATALFQITPSTGWGFSVLLNTTNANCGNNGQVSATINSGTPPYTYLWNGGAVTNTITNLAAGTYQVTVTDSLGCAAIGNTLLQANCVNVIQGNAFIDSNQNCVPEANELPMAGIIVSAANNGFTYYGLTDADGNYSIAVPAPGTYTITTHNNYASGNCGQLSLCNNTSGTVTLVNPGDSSLSNNLAYVAPAVFDYDMFVSWSDGNPGFDKTYSIFPINNTGPLVNAPAVVTFVYDTALVYNSSTPPATHNSAAHTLTWAVPGLGPQWLLQTPLSSTFLVPVNTSLGYMLQSNFSITPLAGDCDTSNNRLYSSDMVTGSYDPNEKEVAPKGNIVEEDSILTYTIHFQNTGTDSTHFIILKDTLSPHLNPASVRNIAASHPYSDFAISGQGILTWTFNPLRLVDSITNEEGSKGFVKFTVKKKPNLPIGLIISNRAAIYFDYNAPIITNTVASTMSLPTYIFALGNNEGITIKAFPNPFSDKTVIAVDGLEDKFSFDLYDLTGSLQKHLANIPGSRFELQRDELAAGVYFYRIYNVNGKQAYGRLVVQ